ncbi:MAG: DUF4338 domain-containing protein [Alicyclobacillus macrosporangiidus]|uniref:Druantia anti-phage system protein DruA n=1 Tax=Alicyclobacillus macrosporangiidus TaxID=392015 RepID=UPI0026EE03E2|nr:Druantia anti-phage system protein DruA [Alicyclobacillus macrosporangiidus]MCL6598516.1 DUF4338 domain-containing protein [Alicyclobacillus macrosporangiidus]
MSFAKRYTFQPNLPETGQPLLKKLCNELRNCPHPKCIYDALDALLCSTELLDLPELDRLATKLFLEVMQDIVRNGWKVEVNDGEFVVIPPDARQDASRDEIKQRLRAALIEARNEQLNEESTKKFITEMERPRYFLGRIVSIQSLFVDPAKLVEDIERRLAAPESIRDSLLRDSIKPYIQLATEDRDEFTNLKLIDIWRYVRYSWSLPYSSQPGRQLHYLVRDAARENHPIIGIGALGNSVVQITCRDDYIGWTLSALERSNHKEKYWDAINREIDRSIEEIYYEDLVASSTEIVAPTRMTLERLRQIANEIPPINLHGNDDIRNLSMEESVRTPMFRRKRALALHELLSARKTFQEAAKECAGSPAEIVERLLATEEGRKALGVGLRSIKKRHIGSSIMEITTCGAIPPYSDFLGGKLVALLMASPRVISDYRQKYENTPSDIASRMKGAEVVKPSDLVLIGTTSLYYVGSSQYNRITAPVRNGVLKYVEVGKTRGFGSVHLSNRTYRTIQQFLESNPSLGKQSSTFAAGVNYKMRSIGYALSHLGLSKLMQHESPRIVYVVPTATNWKECLLGMDDAPTWIYGDISDPQLETEELISFWKERWYVPRLKNKSIRIKARKDNFVALSNFFIEKAAPQPGEWCDNYIRSARPFLAGGVYMSSCPTISWRQLASFNGQRASFAERLTDQELQAIHIPMKLDNRLLNLVRQGKRVYLVGNPGDGKTHAIRRIKDELDAFGIYYNLDASAVQEDELLHHLRQVIELGKSAVIAINEGPLRRLLPLLPADEREQIEIQLDRPFDSIDHTFDNVMVINLGLRQVLSPTLVDAVLHTVLNKVDYSDAPQHVQHNRRMLSTERVRERVKLLLSYVNKSGHHVTMHELLGLFAFVITGSSIGSENLLASSYYELFFHPHNPLIRLLQEWDPSQITDPIVDMQLWDRVGGEGLEWLGEDVLKDENIPRFSEPHFISLKRRYYFEANGGADLLEQIAEERRSFFELLSGQTYEKHMIKYRLIQALSKIFGFQYDRQARDIDTLRIWTGLKYFAHEPPTAFLSTKQVSVDELDVVIPTLRSELDELIEFEPTHVRLVVRPKGSNQEPITLDIDLKLWTTLLKIERGLPLKFCDPAIRRRLTHFMSRVSAHLHAEDASTHANVWVQDVEGARTLTFGITFGADAKGLYEL